MKWSPSFSLHRPRPTYAYALLSYCSSSYSVAAAAAAGEALQPRFMAEYLVTSCSFSPEEAAEASKLLGGVTSRQQPDSVLGFFKSYGFDDPQVKKLLSCNPQWLRLDVEKTLAPKFRAFQDLGFSQSNVAQLLRSNPIVINQKLRTFVPKIQLWQGLIGSNDLLVKLFKRNPCLTGSSIKKRVLPNLEMLRGCGIAEEKLMMILQKHPRILVLNPETLKALIGRVDDLGVPRTSGMFHWALWVLHMVSPERFKAKLEVFGSFGWSEADFRDAFRRCPCFLTGSLKSSQRKMEFFVHDVGCSPSYIARRPQLLAFSLEKRLIPRHRLLTALKSRGLRNGDHQVSTVMTCPEKNFFEKYVICYMEKYPELIELYTASFQNRSAP